MGFLGDESLINIISGTDYIVWDMVDVAAAFETDGEPGKGRSWSDGLADKLKVAELIGIHWVGCIQPDETIIDAILELDIRFEAGIKSSFEGRIKSAH
jgi:hypothetical protein